MSPHSLPYGRTSDRADFTRVLSERRGTCSTKHALLAALAREALVRVPLRLGIYSMDDVNTPGVGEALRLHGLSHVPEAHCVLVAEDGLVDVTFPGSDGRCALTFIAHRDITPEEIGRSSSRGTRPSGAPAPLVRCYVARHGERCEAEDLGGTRAPLGCEGTRLG